MTDHPLTDQQLASAIYDSLAAFAGVACWNVLQYAQNRQYLAEHLTEALEPLLVAEVRRLRFRLAELGEQGPDDRETVSEAAQMYRSLRPVIESTMADPDRWDGDEDESFHLGRYVEWLAAERAQVRTEVLTEAGDKLDRIGHTAAAWILRDDASRAAAVPAAVESE